ncbi:amino acid transporter [Schizophyllum commune Tattone D]|nr:amino acid transporter [Schizophyllum commune Tattone D]
MKASTSKRSQAAIATATADEALLAELGYKQEFQRAFRPIEVFGVSLSIIGLLPSIASVLFYALPNGAGPGMVWGWFAASILILSVAAAMGELASAAPTSGGLYFWTYSLSSPRWRTLLCWIVGYANTIGSVAAVASIDWGCAVQVMAAAGIGSGTNEAGEPNFMPTNAEMFATYALLLATHALLCSIGTQALARLQSFYVGVNGLLCLALLIALPICTPSDKRNTASFALGSEGWVNLNGWPSGFAFIMSFLAPLWTICSFDSAVHISEEATNAARAVPMAIVGACAVGGVVGFAINIALAFCMGTDIEALYDAEQPLAAILLPAFGQKGTLAFWAFVVAVQYMMGSSMLLAASRQTFAFSRDGALPFSNWLYRMNDFTGTPVNTVWFVAFLSLLLGLLAFAGDQAINAVFSLSVIALYIAYIIPIVARFTGDNDFKPGPFSLGKWSFPISFLAVAFMTLMSVVFLFPATPNPAVPDMNYSVVVLGGVLGASVVYFYVPRYGGKYWFTGPVSTVEEDGVGAAGGRGGGHAGGERGRAGVEGESEGSRKSSRDDDSKTSEDRKGGDVDVQVVDI